MPGHPESATPFSLFISYASADRATARLLGDALTKAGLDVWFDEEELAGGEAWDAKIRRQIRTCTYFMPVISATTEARREGYFRREWRLAVERTLDLADDVTFLLPVVIDDTRDHGARVPEKFTTVQWLRCPGGRETPQLLALARKLAATHEAPPAPAAPPPVRSAPPPPAAPAVLPPKIGRPAKGSTVPPPFPDFPPFPAAGHRARFVYDLVVWAGHLIHALWLRLPRWLRVIAMVMIVFNLVDGIFRSSRPEKTAEEKAVRTARLGQALSDHDGGGDPTVQKILQATGAALDTLQGGRPLALIAFGSTEPAVAKPALQSFAALRAQLDATGHERQVALGVIPLAANFDDADALARAGALKCRWLLAGTARPADGGQFTLAVKLYETASQKIIWQTERTAAPGSAAAVGTALAAELLPHVPFAPADN